jgi:tetratricopeptide (TPR) repeat protein
MRLTPMALVVCSYSATAAHAQPKQRLELGQQLEHAGRFEEAGKIFEQELRDAEREEPRSVRVGEILADLANLAGIQGRYREAGDLCERAAATLERSLGPNAPATLNILHRLANASMNLGRYEKAERLLLRVIAAQQRKDDSEAAQLVPALCDLGLVYLGQHKPEKAEPLVRRALTIVESNAAGSEIELAATLTSMAWVMLASARSTEGIAYAERSQTLLLEAKAPAKDAIDTWIALACLYVMSGRFDEAARYAQAATQDSEDAYGPNHFRVALALRVYAAILRRQKRKGEAALAEDRAGRILAQSGISLGNTIDVTALLPTAR